MMTILDAQKDMRAAYFGGATGAFSSATVWLIAALFTIFNSPISGIITLIVGGMFIFPASVLLSKLLGRSGNHTKGNPFGTLSIYGTIWMVASIPIAYGLSIYRVEWFFPAMLIIIGGRYLTFETIYGEKIYLAFGGALILSSVVLTVLQSPAYIGALTGALIEFAFGTAIFIQSRKGM